MNKFDLSGRKALVTGGARGLGEGMAQALAQAGASVMIGDVLASLGRDTAGRLSAGGAKVGFVPLDVTKDEDWVAAIKTTVDTLAIDNFPFHVEYRLRSHFARIGFNYLFR